MTADRSISEQVRALTQLQDLSIKISGPLSLNETLDAIIDSAMVICRADKAAVSVFDEAGNLCLLRHKGLSNAYLEQRRLHRRDAVLVDMIKSRQPSIIEDIDVLAGVSPNHDAWKRERVASIVTLPLVREGEMFGVIGAGSGTIRRYSKAETDSMAVLATQAGAAITAARLLDQLREANRAKDDFFSTLSHELRTPLTPILGWTHLLKPFRDRDPLLSEGLDTIDRNARQLSGLIKDLLDLTRVMSNKIELDRQPTDLVVLVKTVINQMRPQADARGLRLTLETSDERIVGNVDTNRIQQILSNLLDNAIKFTPHGGQIIVSVKKERTPDGVEAGVIKVVDTGIGIKPEFLPRVFERFTQAETGANREISGLGLGLAIAKALAEAHGGKVTAHSEGPGRGSAFAISLRLRSADRTGEAERLNPSTEVIPRDEKLDLRVLLIEDSVDTSHMLSLWLGTYGCRVLVASEAVTGMKLALEEIPDLIISDIGMPDMDGYELMRTLRKLPKLAEVPSIALTGYARDEDRELALSAGYSAHLSKPAEMSRLLNLIKNLTRH